ncbi:MAG: peptidoglycan DD-metalloendopeptidase family protein [Syntrophobacteraceae bacterium]
MSSSQMKKLGVKNSSGSAFYMVSPKRRFRGRHLFIILLIMGMGFGIYRKLNRPKANPPQQRPAIETVVSKPIGSPSQMAATAHKPEAPDTFEIRHLVLHSGDTLAGIVETSGMPGSYSDDWRKACASAPFDRIHEGDELILILSRADAIPVEVVYLQSDGPSYRLRKNSTGWECGSGETAAGRSGKTVRSAWSENFYDSCIAGGLPTPLISNLADIFSYDIDFTSDLKDGDCFAAFFQEAPIPSSEGKQFLLLAAEMSVSGKVYQAFGFQLPDGSWDYFDAKGASLKRAFLKSPIQHRQLLSSKECRNIKPVLKIYRPRLGIDYVAPRGTEVCSIGDGVVSAVRKNANRVLSIAIRHRGGYTSWYGNLSSCSRGMTRGSPVSQAEVIGSIGAARGGNFCLNFHLYKDGKPANFRTADFTRSKSVPKTIVSEFEKSRDFCSAALHGGTPDGQNHEIMSGRD